MKQILDWIYPRHCPFCDKLLLPGKGKICIPCRNEIPYIFEPICKKCGKQLQSETAEYCRDCEKQIHYYDYGMALLSYKGTVKGSVYRFKYQGRMEYAQAYGEEIIKQLEDRIRAWKADGIVPVPLHKKKELKRGFNQADLLAREIGKYFQIPVYNNIVKRVKNTVPQKELNLEERQNNLKRAFKICQNDVKLSTIIIIDDIYTTGSTMDQIAKELRRIGVRKIYYLSLAIGEN